MNFMWVVYEITNPYKFERRCVAHFLTYAESFDWRRENKPKTFPFTYFAQRVNIYGLVNCPICHYNINVMFAGRWPWDKSGD